MFSGLACCDGGDGSDHPAEALDRAGGTGDVDVAV
jgi:hypothetical protein